MSESIYESIGDSTETWSVEKPAHRRTDRKNNRTGVFMAGPTFDQSINTEIVSTIDASASVARVLNSYSHCFQWLRKRKGGSEKGKQFRFYEHINLGRFFSRTTSKFRECSAIARTKGIFLRRLTDISRNPFGITTWGVAYLMSRSIFELAKVFRVKTLGNKWKCYTLLCFWFFLQFWKIIIEITSHWKLLEVSIPCRRRSEPQTRWKLEKFRKKSITRCSQFRTWMLLLVALFCGSLASYICVAAKANKLCKWLLYFCLLTMQFTALHFHVSEDSRRKSKINISQSRLLVSFMKYATNINLISTLISISAMTLSGVSSRAFFSFSLYFLCEPSYWVNV